MVDAEDLLLGDTAPTASLMACADARSCPIGFSSTTRDDAVTRPWLPSESQIGPNSAGAQAR